jgi:hypothetical protein
MTQHDGIKPPQNPLNAYGVSAASWVVGDPPVQPPAHSDKTGPCRKDRKEKMETELELLFGGKILRKNKNQSEKAEKSKKLQTVEIGHLEAELERLFSVDTGDKSRF